MPFRHFDAFDAASRRCHDYSHDAASHIYFALMIFAVFAADAAADARPPGVHRDAAAATPPRSSRADATTRSGVAQRQQQISLMPRRHCCLRLPIIFTSAPPAAD